MAFIVLSCWDLLSLVMLPIIIKKCFSHMVISSSRMKKGSPAIVQNILLFHRLQTAFFSYPFLHFQYEGITEENIEEAICFFMIG